MSAVTGWDWVPAAIDDGYNTPELIARYLCVTVDEVWPLIAVKVADGWLEWACGRSHEMGHFNDCKLRCPTFRLSPVGAR